MYLSIGSDMAVRGDAIVGIFDLDNTTCSRHTRNFLRRAEENGQVVSATDELPKAFVLTREFTMDRVYLTQFSAATIERRGARQAFDTTRGQARE
ncbi:MAG: DUF370 domain-containing protein [Oscillospiraceae bacterium]|nr:DUF370 domain-containing protein [Oscillospiraceae bacterium]